MALPADHEAARELQLFIENTGELYPQKLAILKNLRSKVAKGKYDPTKAWKAWMHWVEVGVRRYAKELMGGDHAEALRTFSAATRRQVAQQIARETERRSEDDEGLGLPSHKSLLGFLG